MISEIDAKSLSLSQRVEDLCKFRGISVKSIQVIEYADGNLQVLVERDGPVLKLNLDSFSPGHGILPQISIADPTLLLAHVSYSGIICVNDGQGLSIDESDLDAVYSHVIAKALEVLAQAELDARSGKSGFFDEFEGYWEGLPSASRVRSSVSTDGNPRLLYAHISEKSSPRKCVYFTEHSGGNVPLEFRTSKLTNRIGLYLPLDSNIAPPLPGKVLDIGFIEQLLANMPPAAQVLWEAEISHRWRTGKHLVPLLVSQPRESGGPSLVGVMFYLQNGGLDPKEPVIPLVVKRHTSEFMRERGGANLALTSKHIAVIGCGSVGSEIADALAASGVGRLTLVDPERFEVENVFRHVLGRKSIGVPKVEALKEELETKFPDMKVTSFIQPGIQWLEKTEIKHIDGIVIAIGQPMVERHLANAIRQVKFKGPFVVTWLEPLGLGGHVISLSGSSPGCLDCVYYGEGSRRVLAPRISFIRPNQHVSRNLTGCVGAFIPYSALHSRRTALLAAESLFKLLNGYMAPFYDYWVGDPSLAAMAGIQVSEWFEKASKVPTLEASKHLFEKKCEFCAGVK